MAGLMTGLSVKEEKYGSDAYEYKAVDTGHGS